MADKKTSLKSKFEDQLRFEKLISFLSARFVKLPPENVDPEIEQALHEVMTFFHCDRCGLIQVHPQKVHTNITHACYAEGIERVSGDVNLADLYPWHYKKLIIEKQPVCINRLSELPPEAQTDRQSAMAMGIKSLIFVPVLIRNRVAYLAGIQSLRKERIWPNEYIPRFQLLGEIFASALSRRDADRTLASLSDFEKLLSDLSTRFISLPAEHIDEAIEEAQKIIAQYLGVERCAVFQYSHTGDRILVTHSWNHPKWPPVQKIDAAKDYPWTYKEMEQGHMVHFSTLSELPPEAARDRETHKSVKLKSQACLPLCAGNRMFGALAFGALQEERVWAEELINRLRIVAQIFSNVLARKNAEEQLQERILEIEKLKEQLEKDNAYLREEVRLLFEHEEIVGESDVIRKVLLQAEQVAPTDSTVIILGETGTGKELLARAIYDMSPRKDRPLVTVNCAALPPSLIESELFGRERGAYTGALTKMIGRFETANGSTLFLDEIGELPYELQSKLLRVLETGQFERLGSTRTIKVNVRLITATNRDLAQDVKSGKFRNDLYYRLSVFPLVLPPLRERLDDIPALVWSFVRHFEKKMGKKIDSIPSRSMDALRRYSWPGNIRELKNAVEHAMIVSKNILEVFLPAFPTQKEPDLNTLEDMERKHILKVLQSTNWRIAGRNGAAEQLGMKRTTLNTKMKKLGISRLNT